jgi:hypothetical protein
VRRGRWSAVELEDEVVEVAVIPVLARLEGADQRVTDVVEMGGGMTPW